MARWQYQHYAVYIMIWFQHGRYLESTKLCYDHFDAKHHNYSDSITENLCGINKEFWMLSNDASEAYLLTYLLHGAESFLRS